MKQNEWELMTVILKGANKCWTSVDQNFPFRFVIDYNNKRQCLLWLKYDTDCKHYRALLLFNVNSCKHLTVGIQGHWLTQPMLKFFSVELDHLINLLSREQNFCILILLCQSETTQAILMSDDVLN